MHDPPVLVVSIKRPWPRLRKGPFHHRYWPGMVDVWHDDPDDHDSGTVCGHYPRTRAALAWWLWCHRRHLRVKFMPARAFNRWAFQRCEHCKGKSRKGHPVNTSHQWDSDPQPWGRSKQGLYHGHCSGVVTLQRSLTEAREALRRADVSSLQLELAGMESTAAWRVVHYASKVAASSEGKRQ